VVGPFYLGLGLGLSATAVGYVMSIGPIISIVSGAPSGRLVDVWGTRPARNVGLVALTAGAFALGLLPTSLGVAGYVLGILLLTPGYQLVQAANNTAALADVPKDRRGTVSGLLTISRNVGLIAGASALAAVFAFSVGGKDLAQASSAAIATGMRMTFLCAAGLTSAAILIGLSWSPATYTVK
jgi:MFS family permease